MKNRFLISILLAFLLMFVIKMNILEETIKGLLYCELTWVSFSDACQYPWANAASINNALTTLAANDAIDQAKSILFYDFWFMACAYPLLFLLLRQLSTLYDKTKRENLIMVIKILAGLQFLSWSADITENIILLNSLDKLSLVVSGGVIRAIKIVKWGFSLIAVVVFIVATIIWMIGFIRETEKASADVNY